MFNFAGLNTIDSHYIMVEYNMILNRIRKKKANTLFSLRTHKRCHISCPYGQDMWHLFRVLWRKVSRYRECIVYSFDQSSYSGCCLVDWYSHIPVICPIKHAHSLGCAFFSVVILSFVWGFMWLINPYSSGLLHWFQSSYICLGAREGNLEKCQWSEGILKNVWKTQLCWV